MTELSGHIRFTGEQAAVRTMTRVNTAISSTYGTLGRFLTRAELSERELGRLKRGLVAVTWAAKNLRSGFKAGLSLMGRWMAGATALAGVMGAAANNFGNYSMKLSEVSTLLPVGARAFDQYDNSVKRLAISTGQAADVVAEGLYQALSAGVPADNVVTFLENAANMSIGGVTDMKTSVDGLTSVMNAYGLGAEQAEIVSATFFQTMRGGKTTVGEVARSVGQLAPMASQLGVSFQELGSAWVSLTLTGLSTQEATTQIKALMTGMLRPSAEATEMAKQMGIEWDITSNVARLSARGFVGALEDLQRATRGEADKLAILLPNVRALGGGMRLASEEGRRAFDAAMTSMPKSAEHATAIISDAVGKMKDDVGFKMKQLKAALAVGWLEIGEGIIAGLAPNLDGAVQSVEEAGERMRLNATAFASGIREGLLASGIGETMRKLFNSADSQKSWKELGEVIGRVTGEIIALMGRMARAMETLAETFGGLDNAAMVLFGGWLGTKALMALAALRTSLALTAGASATAASQMGWIFAGKAGLVGLAIGAGYVAGEAIGDPLSNIGNGKTADSSWYDPKFVDTLKGRAISVDRGPTGDGIPINTPVAGAIGRILSKAMAGDRDAIQIASRGGVIQKVGLDPIQRARLQGTQKAADRIAEVRQASTARDEARMAGDLEQAKTEMAREALLSFEGIGGSFERLGDRIGQVVEGSINRAKSTVETIMTLEVKDKRGGSRTARRKERGVGPALGPKVALSNYFVLTDDDEVLSIPDEFIYNMGPAQMAD